MRNTGLRRYRPGDLARLREICVLTGAAGSDATGRWSTDDLLPDLFLEPYVIEGERHHPGQDAVLHGVLLATRDTSVVTVPIWTWTGQDGAPRFLCQASDDGSAPAISVFANSAGELLNQIEARLAEPG